jgi:hypothetical protein
MDREQRRAAFGAVAPPAGTAVRESYRLGVRDDDLLTADTTSLRLSIPCVSDRFSHAAKSMRSRHRAPEDLEPSLAPQLGPSPSAECSLAVAAAASQLGGALAPPPSRSGEGRKHPLRRIARVGAGIKLRSCQRQLGTPGSCASLSQMPRAADRSRPGSLPTAQRKSPALRGFKMGRGGIEPPTLGLRVPCSAN